MKSHTYKEDKKGFKCETCDFTEQNGWTLQIHHGKCHSKIFECGLCDFQAKNLDSLELHLKTCEIYECEECELVSKSFVGMKNHRSEKNTKCESSTVFHVKMDRDNEETASCTDYQQSELFLKTFAAVKI